MNLYKVHHRTPVYHTERSEASTNRSFVSAKGSKSRADLEIREQNSRIMNKILEAKSSLSRAKLLEEYSDHSKHANMIRRRKDAPVSQGRSYERKREREWVTKI